jgi:hypothetical protein
MVSRRQVIFGGTAAVAGAAAGVGGRLKRGPAKPHKPEDEPVQKRIKAENAKKTNK